MTGGRRNRRIVKTKVIKSVQMVCSNVNRSVQVSHMMMKAHFGAGCEPHCACRLHRKIPEPTTEIEMQSSGLRDLKTFHLGTLVAPSLLQSISFPTETLQLMLCLGPRKVCVCPRMLLFLGQGT